MIAYLAGPMSGIPEFNYPAFAEHAKYIREQLKYEVISPAEQGFGSFNPGTTGYEEVLNDCVKLVSLADMLFVMEGWTKSNGARAEVMCAAVYNMPIHYIKESQTPGGLRYFEHHYIG
jgi:hypothetical protein